ncbi:MAG: hypothetical protein KY463_07680 [Actinobacteria bacterium]|nr:hypothetical protein [Actinomycetota bacterium]
MRSRRTLICMLWIPFALAAAGCGGDGAFEQPTATAPQPPPPLASDDSPGGEPALPSCDAARITEHGGRQGTCVIGNVTRTVANRARPLVLDDEIAIRLEDLVVRPRGSHRMVVVSLRVENLGARSFRWPRSAPQIALWVDDRLRPQDADERALALEAVGTGARPSVALAPGRVATVAAGWRLAPAAAARLRDRGSAIIVVPPHDGGRQVKEALRIGVLRLWR